MQEGEAQGDGASGLEELPSRQVREIHVGDSGKEGDRLAPHSVLA
jgi:hypothetical protein